MPPDPVPWYETWLLPAATGVVGTLVGAFVTALQERVQKLPGRLWSLVRRSVALAGRKLWLAASGQTWSTRACAEAVQLALEGIGVVDVQREPTLSVTLRLVNRSPYRLHLTVHAVLLEPANWGNRIACAKSDSLDLPSAMLAGGSALSVGARFSTHCAIDPIGLSKVRSSIRSEDESLRRIPHHCAVGLDAYVHGPTGGEKFAFLLPAVLVLQR